MPGDKKNWSVKHIVQEIDGDFLRRMTIGRILDHVSMISTLHVNEGFGISEKQMRDCRAVFMLAKLSVKYYEDIFADEEITLKTTPAEPRRAVWQRCTSLTKNDGTVAAEVDAKWVLVDPEKRRILRAAPAELGLDLTGYEAPFSHDFLPLRPENKDEMTFISEERAVYSRVDKNMHMNHARYADIVMDAMGFERFKEGRPKQFCISYHKELPMGESLKLYGGKNGEADVYKGVLEDGSCSFEASVIF